MLGLDDYSSDEEEAQETSRSDNRVQSSAQAGQANGNNLNPQQVTKSPPQANISATNPTEPTTTRSTAPILGPSAQEVPTTGTTSSNPPSAPLPPPPSSTHTTQRALIHSLTLPTYPNTAIPPSPPGSPSPATTAKIDRFLALKSQGIHYTARLADSPALKNPALFRELMEFAGIQGEEQYISALPPSLRVVPEGGFKEEEYVEELLKRQKRRHAEEKGMGVEFVGARRERR